MNAPSPPSNPPGIDVERVETWLRSTVPDVVAPLSFRQIAGGLSNLTFAVTDAGGQRWALRRPPLGVRLASAHDMGRECRILAALGPTEVPVPRILGLSEGEDPYYVMSWVEGPVLRSLADAEAFPDRADRRAIGERLVDSLVAIHAVDPDGVGLGDLARPDAYVERQLRRWQGQWREQRTRDLPLIDDVHRRLIEQIPAQGKATLVHGDYRLDNVILDPDGRVRAVVDWELCTLGDPLADLGLLLVYWEQQHPLLPGVFPATTAEGFPSPHEATERYATQSGRDLSKIDFFVALGQWKLAIILEGVLSRNTQHGSLDQASAAQLTGVVEQLAIQADAAVDRLSRS